jgi:hypothetical protein
LPKYSSLKVLSLVAEDLAWSISSMGEAQLYRTVKRVSGLLPIQKHSVSPSEPNEIFEILANPTNKRSIQQVQISKL